MKKTVSLVVSVMLALTTAVTGSAATIDSLSAGVGTDEDRTVSVRVVYKNTEDAQESTLLVIKKGESIVTAPSSAFRYVDQKDVDGNTVTYEFKMAKGDRTGKYDLYIGGTNVDSPESTVIDFDLESTVTIKFVDENGTELCEKSVVNCAENATIDLEDYAENTIEYNGAFYVKKATNPATFTAARGENEVEIVYALDDVKTIENVNATVILGNEPVLPTKLSAVTETGRDTTVEITKWDCSSLKAGQNTVYGSCKNTEKKAQATVNVLPLSFEIQDGSTQSGGNTVSFASVLETKFTVEFDMIVNSIGDAWALFTTDGATWGNSAFGISVNGGALFVRGGNGSGTPTDAVLKQSVSGGEKYRVMIVADLDTNTFSTTVTGSDGTVYTADELNFRRNMESINSVNFIGPDGCVDFENIKVSTENAATVKFVNENSEIVKTVICNATAASPYTINAGEAFAISSDGTGAFYAIPKTTVSEDTVVTVKAVENKFAVTEDVFVQGNTVYGVGTTNDLNVFVGTAYDTERGVLTDADGAALTDGVHEPSVLMYSRVGFFLFPVIDVPKGKAAVANFYAKSWNANTFSNGNTQIRLSAYAVNDDSWAKTEKGTYVSAEAPLLEGCENPMYSAVCGNEAGNITIDITEAMVKAKALGLETIAIKLNASWGGVYIAEREAAVDGGSCEGKAAYVTLTDAYNMSVTGAKKVTKAGTLVEAESFAVPKGTSIKIYAGDESVVAYTDETKVYATNNGVLDLTPNGDMSLAATGLGVSAVDGAQVRIGSGTDENGKVGEGSGLRFIVTVERLDSLACLSNATFGVRIAAEGSDAYVDVAATLWQNDDVFTAAITNLSESNYNRDFTATPYITVDGQTFFANSVTRSVYKVAAGLLAKGYSGGEYGQESDKTGTDYTSMSEALVKVLNAYVNQVGIRLTFNDTDGSGSYTEGDTLTAREGNVSGAYKAEAFFTVSDTRYENGIFEVDITPNGEKTKINMNYWNDYIRINNNNSVIKSMVKLEENANGTYTLKFDVN